MYPQPGPAPQFQQPPPRRTGLPAGGVFVLVFLAFVLGGCSGLLVGVAGSDSQAAAPKATITVTRTRPVAAPSQSADPVETAKPTASATPRPVLVAMPNVVGMNHQAAQDLLQSKGIYGLAEEDATGQGRLLVWDRNWEVVRQSIKPGTKIDPATATITLYSKKIGE